MKELLRENSRKYFINALIEWIFWMVGSVLAIMAIKWVSVQYGATQYEFHVWITAILYLWYVSTMSLILGGTYFIARAAQTHLERRQKHPQKPQSIDLTNDLKRVKNIKKRAGIIALVLHTLNAAFIYYISRFIPGITPEFQLYAVLGVFAIAAVKPGFSAVNALRVEILGMVQEADYPIKSVADLWNVVEKFGDYEDRLEATFKEIDDVKEQHIELINEKLKDVATSLELFKTELEKTFRKEVETFQESDNVRQTAYNELKEAQMPVIKEISKILSAIQSLKDFVIELRDKNIKGEQLMSALKEFGIESLADLNVTFEKSVANRNPKLD
jgi:hypothetical protein